MFCSNSLYGFLLLVVESVRAYITSSDVYGLHVVKRGCATHVSMICTHQGTVRNIVLGTVVVETTWEEKVCQVLANWHSCSNTTNRPRAIILVEVGPFSVVLARKVVGGIPLVVPRIDLHWLHNLIHGGELQPLFGVKPYGVVDYLRIHLDSGRNEGVRTMVKWTVVFSEVYVLW